MNFKIIEGGVRDTAFTSKKNFRAAYITDTRLMGVVCVHAIWDLPDNTAKNELHQFFYFDAEEFGFDTYESVLADGPHDKQAYAEIEKILNRMMGGLGAKIRTIKEKEVRYLVQYYADFSIKLGDELPGNTDEYAFLLEPKVDFSQSELMDFMSRACTDITTPYEAINYFIMRNTGKDFIASKFLTKGEFELELFPEHKPASLLRNVIKDMINRSGTNSAFSSTDEHGSFNTRKTYFNESLIEYDDRYFLITTEVSVENLKIVDYKRLSSFEITPIEADFMTSREEHITLLNLKCDPEAFDNDATEFTRRSMLTEHENGRVYMVFFPNNYHVKKPVFKLSDDVLGVYYVSNSGQLLLVSYTETTIRLMENDLLKSVFKDLVEPVAKYCFKKPVFYDFVSSDFDDFLEFVCAVSEPEN